jgi:putative copper resistance protein D
MLEAGLVVSRFLHFSGTLVLFGWLLFPLVVRGGVAPPKAALMILATLSFAAGVGWFIFTAGSMAGALEAALAPATIEAVVAQTSFGPLWLARLAVTAAMLAWVAVRPASAVVSWPLVAVAGLAVASLAGAGHAMLGDDGVGALHMVADALHLLAAGAWLGSIAGLALMLTATVEPRVVEAVGGFSGLGYGAVAVLLASGAANSWIMLGSPAALFSTPYGRLLSAKIVLFLVMLVLAAHNRFRLAPRLAVAGEASTHIKLRRNALAELAVGAVVIATVAALGTMQPPSG